MELTVRTVEYFYARVATDPDKAYELLAKLAAEEINLLAFSAVPFGDHQIELTLFPNRSANLLQTAAKLGWNLTGPQHAALIQAESRW
jgi:hypothetical protein